MLLLPNQKKKQTISLFISPENLNLCQDSKEFCLKKKINDVILEIEMGEFQQPSSSRNSFNNVAEVASAFQGPCMPALTNNNLNLL